MTKGLVVAAPSSEPEKMITNIEKNTK